MGKRFRITLAVLVVAIVGVIGWQVWPPPEPLYQGKPLSSWLKVYMTGEVDEANEAVRQTGTNAIPTLLRLLRTKDSALNVKLMALAEKQHLIRIRFARAEDWNFAAELGLLVLGTNAQSAVPALIGIVDQSISPASQFYAISVLGDIGPPAKEAVPSLLRWVTNADFDVRVCSIQVLGYIHAEPDQVVPVLTNALHDPNPTNHAVRDNAIQSLGRFAAEAKLAVPTLVELLNKEQNLTARLLITNALKAIDPEAAAKAAVK